MKHSSWLPPLVGLFSSPTHSRRAKNKLFAEGGPRGKEQYSGTEMFTLGEVPKFH